jgi:predicted ferric reductase
MRKPKEVEGRRLAPSSLSAVALGEAAKLYQASFVVVQAQAKLPQSRFKLAQEALAVGAILEAYHAVIGVSHDVRLTSGRTSAPAVCP